MYVQRGSFELSLARSFLRICPFLVLLVLLNRMQALQEEQAKSREVPECVAAKERLIRMAQASVACL